MNPGDRFRDVRTDRHGFVLYKSNINDDQVLARFDGNDFNTTAYAENLEVLPSQPFRPASERRPVVKVKYHLAYWPYKDMPDTRSTLLHTPGRWSPPMGAFVTDVTVE